VVAAGEALLSQGVFSKECRTEYVSSLSSSSAVKVSTLRLLAVVLKSERLMFDRQDEGAWQVNDDPQL
jgi:hypothetical protein